MPTRFTLYDLKALSEPIKLGDSQISVSPSLQSTLLASSFACCAPDVIIRLSRPFIKQFFTASSFFRSSLSGEYPSVILYCKAPIGSELSISDEIFSIVSFGNASAAGFPAANGITSGFEVCLRISRIADGFSFETLSEK